MSFFSEKNINIEEYKKLDPKELKIRKKLSIHVKDKSVLLYTEQKSRVLQKDVESFEDIFKKIQDYKEMIIGEKQIAINAPLCSKAKARFEDFGWTVIS